MEISSLYTADSHANGAEMQVKDQFGSDTDGFISFVGMDSDLWRKNKRESDRAALMAEMGKSDDDTDFIALLLSKAALSWRGFTKDGEDMAFSTEAVLALFEAAPYILSQANHFIGNNGNFTES